MICATPSCQKVIGPKRKYCSHACANLDILARRAARVNGPAKRGGKSLTVHQDGTGTAEAVCKAPTLEALVEACKIDLKVWQVTKQVANVWGDPANQQWQVKAWLAPRTAVLGARKELDSLIAQAKERIPARPKIKVRPADNGCALELAIPDAHFGKLGWQPETGYASYDLKTAEQVFDAAVDALLARTSSFPISRIVFPVGHDILHSDTKQGTTNKGTPLDTDSRYHKSFETVRRVIVRTIERLRQIAPVDVIMVPGNHDTLSVYHLGDSLSCFYHATPDVTVQNEPNPRKYWRFGKVLLLFTHGHTGKGQNLPLLMATERPVDFGECTHREAHTGHLHKTKVDEFMGIKVRISPALSGVDAWHSDNHFVGNSQGAEAYVWHPEEGLIATAQYTVPTS